MAFVTSGNTTFFRVWLVGKNQEADPLHQHRPFDYTALPKMAYQWLRLFATSFFDLLYKSARE